MIEDDESWTVGYTVPAEMAGIFDESKYNVRKCNYISKNIFFK